MTRFRAYQEIPGPGLSRMVRAMAYIVHDLSALRMMNASDDDAMVVQEGCKQMERSGFILTAVVPQYQTWSESGMPDGMGDVLFIFHNPNM